MITFLWIAGAILQALAFICAGMVMGGHSIKKDPSRFNLSKAWYVYTTWAFIGLGSALITLMGHFG